MRPKSSVSGKTSSCSGRKTPARVDEVERGNAVFEGDGLRAKDFLRGHGKKRAGLHGCVVGDDHAQAAADAAQAGDDAGGWRAAIFGVHAVRCPEAEFEELGIFIEQQLEALADCEATFGALRLGGFWSATFADLVLFGSDCGQKGEQPLAVRESPRGCGVKIRAQAVIEFEVVRHAMSCRVQYWTFQAALAMVPVHSPKPMRGRPASRQYARSVT